MTTSSSIPAVDTPTTNTTTTHQPDSKQAAADFFNEFQKYKEALLSDLDALAPGASKQQLGVQFEAILQKISELDKKITAATLFLPSYDQRQYSVQLKQFTDQLNTKKSELTPKSKFSFKSRSTAASSSSTTSSSTVKAGLATNAPSSTSNESLEEKPAQQLANAHIISSLIDTYHEPTLDGPKDVLIRDVSQSIVNFFPRTTTTTMNNNDKLTTLHLQNIQKSIILTGPVKGSVMIENCQDCIILTACRQFRMHKSTDTRVFLLCGSLPIVEDVNTTAFGPYFVFGVERRDGEEALDWLRQEFAAQNIPVTVEHYNNYKTIQDFNWIKAAASPNWRLLGEDEIGSVRDGLRVTEKLVSLGGSGTETESQLMEEWMKLLQKRCVFVPI